MIFGFKPNLKKYYYRHYMVYIDVTQNLTVRSDLFFFFAEFYFKLCLKI